MVRVCSFGRIIDGTYTCSHRGILHEPRTTNRRRLLDRVEVVLRATDRPLRECEIVERLDAEGPRVDPRHVHLALYRLHRQGLAVQRQRPGQRPRWLHGIISR